MSDGGGFNASSIFDGAKGSAQGKAGTTVSTFLISLAAGFILFGVQFGIFLLIRNYLWSKRIYQPRSFLIPMKDRVPPPPNNPFRWLWTVFKIREDTEVLRKAGMDAYFFLRYLSMCLKIFTPMAIVILPILIPLNYNSGKFTQTIANTPYNVTGLDTIAWGNLSPNHTSRYWAHCVLAVAVVIWVCFNFHKELLHYIVMRQEYLGSAAHRLKASSTTVLITNIPDETCSVEGLMSLYDDFPGGIRRIWINRNYEKLVYKDKRRKGFEGLLENAETDLIRKAVKRFTKMSRKTAMGANGPQQAVTGAQIELELNVDKDLEKGRLSGEQITEPTTKAICQLDLNLDLSTKAAWTQYLKPSQRPTMRIAKGKHTSAFAIPLIGRWFFATKVDTIYYCRRELARLNCEIEEDIAVQQSYPQNGSAFIQFGSQKAAHLACQAAADISPRYMTKRTVELSPADINWPSLNMSWRSRYVRLISFLLLFALLVLAFGIISFLTSILSGASKLQGANWLNWIQNLPRWLTSFLQGTLPPVIQVILLSGPLPIILRAMTNSTRGATTGSEGERSLQLWYLVFLVIELFLIPTLSTGLTGMIDEIIQGNIPNIVNLLAENLPTAANYYFSFLIIQALSISAASILQTIRLFNFYVIGGVNTPDSVYNKLSWTNRTRIGSNIPWYTTFAVIGLVYSIIAPLMLLFMILTFSLFWIVIKNNILYVIRTGNVDGGGLFFPSAINQTFTGLYFMEICLIGLFFLVRDAHDKVACSGQGVVMAVVLFLTALYQIWLAVNFNGLLKFAPVRLEHIARLRDEELEKERLLAKDQAPMTADSSTINDFGASKHEEASPAPITPGDGSSATNSRMQHAREDVEEKRPLPAPRKVSSHSARGLRARRNTADSERVQDLEDQQRKDEESTERILARINRPLDESRLAELENRLSSLEHRAGNVLIPHRRDIEEQMMNDPISRIIMQHNDELENLEPEERDMLLSVAFTHPVLRETRPSVWIPKDDIGVSDDEVRRTRELSQHVTIDNRGAYFDRKLKVRIDKPPPDMSEFALVMGEL
ncbi:DUF221-domain-containing protein [Tothia fuscella]|uniref:DUF221-domain-containing protein n=1 Tax=Tothia fuscella TaxID=1048955 RepID=A0A9P4U2A6_9PEZI|nr:DUF221-domain-containing protein [Tothia fuscella]